MVGESSSVRQTLLLKCQRKPSSRKAYNANPSNQPQVHGEPIAKVEVEQRAGIEVEPERRGEAHIAAH